MDSVNLFDPVAYGRTSMPSSEVEMQLSAFRLDSLRHRPLVQCGESWAGFLTRLMDANAIQTISQVASIARTTLPRLVSGVTEKPRTTSSDPSSLSSDGLQQFAGAKRWNTSPRDFGRSLLSRVCPACLAGDSVPYIRFDWERPMGLYCYKHLTPLADTCSGCLEPIQSLRTRTLYCKCGASLTRARTSSTVEAAMAMSVVFEEAGSTIEGETFGRFSRIEACAAFSCHWLARPWPQPRARDPWIVAADASAMSAILDDWPKAAVAALLRKEQAPHNFAPSLIGDRLKEKRFSRIRILMDAYRDAKHSSQTKPVSARARVDLHPEKQIYGIKDLMAVTGHSYGTLVRCIDEGLLPGASYQTGAGKLIDFSIPRDLFEQIRTGYAQTDSLKSAAQGAGCTVDVLVGLIAADELASYRLVQTTGGRRTERVRPSDLRQVLEKMSSVARRPDGRRLDRVYMSQWIQKTTKQRCGPRWRALLQAVWSGIVPLYSEEDRATGLSSFFLAEADLLAVCPRRRRS